MKPKTYTIAGIIIMLIAFYLSIDWQIMTISPMQGASLSLFLYVTNIFTGLLPTFLGICAGILIFKGGRKE